MHHDLLAEIRRLNKAGYKDAAIAQKLGLKYSTVRYNRRKMRLPLNVGSFSDQRTRRYCVYDAKTTQFIIEGTAKECAAELGIKVETFYKLFTIFRQGVTRRWEIYYAEAPDFDAAGE